MDPQRMLNSYVEGLGSSKPGTPHDPDSCDESLDLSVLAANDNLDHSQVESTISWLEAIVDSDQSKGDTVLVSKDDENMEIADDLVQTSKDGKGGLDLPETVDDNVNVHNESLHTVAVVTSSMTPEQNSAMVEQNSVTPGQNSVTSEQTSTTDEIFVTVEQNGTTAEENTVDATTAEENTVDATTAEENTVETTTAEENTVEATTAEENTADATTAEENTVDATTAEENTVAVKQNSYNVETKQEAENNKPDLADQLVDFNCNLLEPETSEV